MERRLAAILSYDIVGYTRAMGIDEGGTLERLKADRREIIDPEATRYGGRTIKLMGDGALMEFASVVDAVAFAVSVQHMVANQDGDVPANRRLLYRIGINVGDVIVEGDDIYGDGVNVAVRLEGLAEPGGICIRRNVRNQVRGKLDLDFKDLGEVEVKNIERPIRVFHVIMNDKAEALAATPLTRMRSAGRFSRLRRAAVGLALALLMVVGIGWWQPWAPDFEPVAPATMARALPAKPSIAVLPFDDFSQGEDRGYLSDAIVEGIITELSRFSTLFVIARNSSFHYRDQVADVREIARELGVRYILEGSQQKAADRLRVTVQLIDAVAGNHVWAETYDQELADIFSVQDEIVRTVAATLGEKLMVVAGREAKQRDPANLRAFEYWLKGVSHWREFTREGLEQARQSYLKALELDPKLREAHSGLAFVYARAANWGWTELDPAEAMKRARHHAEMALQINPNDWGAHNAMGYVRKQEGDVEGAIVSLRDAIRLNESSAIARANLAELLVYVGRAKEAVELLEEAMRLDPHHPDWFKWNYAWILWTVGECEEALTSMLSMAKIPVLANRTLASVYVCLGRKKEAEEAIATLLESRPDYTSADVRKSLGPKYRDPAELERWIEALRVAGLPE